MMRGEKTTALVLVAAMGITALGGISRQTQMDTAHEIAELARSIGCGEDNPIILEASRLWWEAHDAEESPDTTYSAEGYEYTAQILAKIIYGEARGIYSQTQQAAIVWTILNRYDAGYGSSIEEVALAPYQFCYRESAPTTDDYGRDLVALVMDVIGRWSAEHAGETDVGRVLPKDYMWYTGNGKTNQFRNAYRGGTVWDWSLPSPYET